jgi:hypothetical protein
MLVLVVHKCFLIYIPAISLRVPVPLPLNNLHPNRYGDIIGI